jgi:hypothetical protein
MLDEMKMNMLVLSIPTILSECAQCYFEKVLMCYQ